MFRVVVITDPETATGFRLAGVEVREAASPQAALEHLRTILPLDYGLVAVNEELLAGTDDERARLLRDRDLPVIIPFPAPKQQMESGEAYISRLVKEHIGFYVKLR